MRIAPCAGVCYKAPVLPQRIASIVGVCLLATACSGVTPANPSGVIAPIALDLETAPSASRSTVQRVEEGGGSGGGGCGGETATTYCATVRLTSGANILNASITGQYTPTESPQNFSIDAALLRTVFDPINTTPPVGDVFGRFTDALLHVTVLNGFATVALTMTAPFENSQPLAAGGTAPVVQSLTPCVAVPGAYSRLGATTTLTLQLQHLGRTEIVINRPFKCSS